MPITISRVTVRDIVSVPPNVFEKYDSLDDRLLAGVENYRGPFALFIAIDNSYYGDDEPIGVAIVTRKGIVTAFIVDHPGETDNDKRVWSQAVTALIGAMKQAFPYLIVHDADEEAVDLWTQHGFQRIPPPNQETGRVVEVLAWNIGATKVWSTLNALRIAWNRDVHRKSWGMDNAPLN